MASGTFTGSRAVNQYGPWLTLTWQEIEQQVANNRTKVRLTLRFRADRNINYRFYSRTGTLYGQNYTYSGSAVGTNINIVLRQRDVWITHNSDGNKSVSFSGNITGLGLNWSGTNVNTMSVSGTANLTRIPRKTDLTSANLTSLVNGSNATLSIGRSVKYSGFHHLVSILDGSTWIWDPGYQSGSPNTSYTIPAATVNKMLNRMSSVTSKTFRVRIRTYTGSNGNGYIGESIRNITVSVHSSVTPTISAVSVSEYVSGLSAQFGAYVQDKSRLSLSMTAGGSGGATIRSYRIVANGATYTSRTATTGTLNNSGSNRITFEVTDSRGRKASTTRDVTVLPYSNPYVTKVDSARVDEEGNIDNNGTNAKVNYRAGISSVNNRNDKSFILRWRASNSEDSWKEKDVTPTNGYSVDASTIINELSVDSAYELQLEVSDYFTSIIYNAMAIPTSFTLINFHPGGEALAIGGVAQREFGFEVYLPTFFEGDIYFEEYPTTRLDRDTDLNTITKPGMYYTPASADAQTMLNTPVDVAFSLLVEKHAGQKQTLTRYQADNPETWIRNSYQGNWGRWRKVAFA